jgi:hypothetical protein
VTVAVTVDSGKWQVAVDSSSGSDLSPWHPRRRLPRSGRCSRPRDRWGCGSGSGSSGSVAVASVAVAGVAVCGSGGKVKT